MVPPKLMCRQHLLGEHFEIHMTVGVLQQGKSIAGFLNGLLEPQSLKKRHDELVVEMKNRGYNHSSPLPEFECKVIGEPIDAEKSIKVLLDRCPKCSERILKKVS